jgi:protein TonB
VLTGDGGIREITICKGSKSSALNTGALAAVRNAASFPKPPANLFKGDLSLNLTIVFDLTS